MFPRADRRGPDGAHQHGGREVLVPGARARARARVDGARGAVQARRAPQLGGRRHVELRRAAVGARHARAALRAPRAHGVRHEGRAGGPAPRHPARRLPAHI